MSLLQKLSSSWLVLLVLVMVLLALCLDTTEARKKSGKKFKAGVCKYERKGSDGPCNTETNTKEVTLPLKKGDPATCQPNKSVTKPCSDNSLTRRKKPQKGCKYERKGSDWTECDPITNERSKVMKLKEGSTPDCPPTFTKPRSCGKNKKGSRKSAAKET